MRGSAAAVGFATFPISRSRTTRQPMRPKRSGIPKSSSLAARLTHTKQRGTTIADIADMISELSGIATVSTLSPSTTLAALEAVDRDGLSWFDALIWATAKQADANVLYSEDFQHGRTLGGITIENPFGVQE